MASVNPQLKVDVSANTTDLSAALVNLAVHGQSISVAFELVGEVKKARDQHGEQRHLPLGTGPEKELLFGIESNLEAFNLADADNGELADAAKLACERAFKRGEGTWQHIITEEWAEAMAEEDPTLLRAELVQLGAMAISAIMALDHQQSQA